MSIELIARGLLTGPRGALVCRNVGMNYAFLPGGHIEFGEPAASALERELIEELGLAVQAGPFLGMLEHSFRQADKPHHELNLVFQMSSPVIVQMARFSPAEAHLEFFWQPLAQLADVNLLPAALVSLAPAWAQGTPAVFNSDMTL